MAVRIKTVGHIVPPRPPDQLGQFGRPGRPCPSVVSSRVVHDQIELCTRDATAGSRVRQCRPKKGSDSGFWHQAKHYSRSQGKLRHPEHVKSRRAVKDSLPEGCCRDLVGDIEDQMHGADHLIDDRLAALPHHGMPVRRLIPEGSARHGYCAQNWQVCVKPAMWAEPTPRRAKSAGI